jgi:alpha-1,3-glucosyltransferase
MELKKSFYTSSPHTSNRYAKPIFLSLVFSPAFLILDHIHFQYNAPLFSILMFSLLEAASNPLFSAFLFASLLCFKHIYLYLAPAYFFYLLRTYCLTPSWRPQLVNTVKLGAVVLTPILVAFGPFLVMGQLETVLKRLFPFQRGLCHAYWAPNFWALYSFVDRVAIHLTPFVGFEIRNAKAVSSLTRGLVGDSSFAVLPEITSGMTFIITLISQMVYHNYERANGSFQFLRWS